MCENTKDKFESRQGSVVKVEADTAGAPGERKRRTEMIVILLDCCGGGGGGSGDGGGGSGDGGGGGGGGVTYSKWIDIW